MEKKRSKATTTRKPPEPSESHAAIDQWMRRVMPDLNPIVERVDELICQTIPNLQFAVKWKRPYYGLPKLGWIIELAAYDVSANVVFYGGADFDPPPPLGEGRGRYVKLTSLEQVESPELREWIEQAARVPGWK
jgi:hypothetical protein